MQGDRLLDLCPYSAGEFDCLGASDYVSECCLAWIDYKSEVTLTPLNPIGYWPHCHWIYCSDCGRPILQFTDLVSLELQRQVNPRYNEKFNRIEIINQTWTGTTITIS